MVTASRPYKSLGAESDARPLHLCPVDRRKLQHSIGFEPATRYRRLLDFSSMTAPHRIREIIRVRSSNQTPIPTARYRTINDQDRE